MAAAPLPALAISVAGTCVSCGYGMLVIVGNVVSG